MKIISEKDPAAISLATEYLCAGKIISFATDTVYGIVADASNINAVEQIYSIKRREKNKPIAIFLPNLLMAEKIFIFDEMAKNIAQKFSKNPLTIILKKQPNAAMHLAPNLNKNDDFLGFRIVKKDFIDKLLKNFGGVLAVTSANISGDKAAISADQVKNYFNFLDIDLLIDGGVCEIKIPSTVIKICDNQLTILRNDANLNINPAIQ